MTDILKEVIEYNEIQQLNLSDLTWIPSYQLPDGARFQEASLRD